MDGFLSYVSFFLQDEVVRISLHARAIRDAEDEELMGFFVGLSPWQVCNNNFMMILYQLHKLINIKISVG